MSEKTIEEKVRDIIVEQLGVTAEQVTTNASFIEDLGADSLDTVELVMAFEEEFGVEVPDEDAEKLQKVGDVVKYIGRSRASKPLSGFSKEAASFTGCGFFVLQRQRERGKATCSVLHVHLRFPP